jgi:hypothetical protein
MLYDRDPLLTLISDKLRVRDYIADRIGEQYLIPLLWHGELPENMPFDDLPGHFVVKANHGCGFVRVIDDKRAIDKSQLCKLAERWLKMNFGKDSFLGIAWGYNNIRPAILIESFLGKAGSPPDDYKFWCFNGRAEVVSVHLDRFGKYRIGCFDRDFLPHELNFGSHQGAGEFIRPANYEAMVNLAERLAKDFNFMRVDLYSVNDSIYFGELTPYPGGVSARILPVNQDRALGDKWPAKS